MNTLRFLAGSVIYLLAVAAWVSGQFEAGFFWSFCALAVFPRLMNWLAAKMGGEMSGIQMAALFVVSFGLGLAFFRPPPPKVAALPPALNQRDTIFVRDTVVKIVEVPAAPVGPVQNSYVSSPSPKPRTKTSKGSAPRKNGYIRGPRGGCYYINGNGKKVYVDHSYCY